MNNYYWITDPHFDHMNDDDVLNFIDLLSNIQNIKGIIITGDISNATQLKKHLIGLSKLTIPTYFVAGNHDYYKGSFSNVDNLLFEMNSQYDNLYWLNAGEVEIDSGAVITGVGGWYDAYYGDTNTRMELNDFYLIEELVPGKKFRNLLIELVRQRARSEVEVLRSQLDRVCERYKRVIIATHVPPYPESSLYRGKVNDDYAAPWFISRLMGELLVDYAERYREVEFIVLCGHSHHPAEFRKRDNLIVYTGLAKYDNPGVAGVFEDNKMMIGTVYYFLSSDWKYRKSNK